MPPTEAAPRGTELSPWFVTGLLEGAGSFTFGRSGRNFNLYLAVKRPAADRPLLEALRRFFGGAGSIYPVRSGTGTRKRATAWYYRINRRDELARVLVHLDRYPLRGAKAETYQAWRRMVAAKSERFRRQNLEELGLLAAELSRRSIRTPPDFS